MGWEPSLWIRQVAIRSARQFYIIEGYLIERPHFYLIADGWMLQVGRVGRTHITIAISGLLAL